MFLEFDISISHSVRDTFLSTGNEAAYRVSVWHLNARNFLTRDLIVRDHDAS